MSANDPQTLVLDDHYGQANDIEEISVDSLVIAQVLGRAHRTAEAEDAPNEARAILHMAQSFADELATTDPAFDRQRFIQAATEHQP